MGIRSEWVRYGAAATDRLAALVTEVQAGDPLAPVTVIVPTNSVGVTARRALGGRPGGVANVAFTTIDQLAHDIAGPGLEAHGRHQLTDQIRAAAVRLALRADPRCFGAVADHPSTDRAVAEALAAVRRGGAAVRTSLARDPRRVTGDVLAIGDQVAAHLTGYYDEVDLATVARSLVDPAGGVVVHLPGWLPPAQRALVGAMAERADVVVLAGVVGDSAADAAIVDLCRHLGAPVGPIPGGSSPAGPSQVRSVSDPDDEARHAVRWLLAQRAGGVPFERMAVLYTAATPYRRALHRHLESAGVPNNGPAVGTVGETVAGRFIRSVLSLVEGGFHREQVIALVSSGPIVSPDGVAVRSTMWDRATRRAGVVRGLDQWRDRLAARASELLDGESSPANWRVLEAASCVDVARFVDTLAGHLAELDAIDTWAGFAQWLVTMLHRYLAAPAGRSRWPEHEREAAERFELTIGLLAGLDAVEPSPSRIAMEAAVAVELDRPTRRTGRLGEGVLVGPLSVGVGADLDAVAIVGAIEGLAPRPVRHGVILGAVEHAIAGPDLGGDTVEAQHRAYLAALSSAPEDRRLVLTSRGDLRSGRLTFRSRWLESIDAVEVPSASAAWLPEATEPAATIAEYQLRQLSDAPSELDAMARPLIAAVPHLAVGAQLVASRRWGGLTPWSGLVDGGGLAAILERELSATALERYAKCPFEFFLADVLGIRDVERPEDVETVNPLDRGRLIHAALEDLIRERIDAGHDASIDTAAELQRLYELVDAELDAFERSGRTGRALGWELERTALAAQAGRFVILDHRARQAGWVAESAELHFGGSDRPVAVELADGRTLRFRGSADRVDRAPDGSALVVDYKTVRESKDPEEIRLGVYQGRLVQLPIYARAAEASGGSAQAAYWYLPRVGAPAMATVDLAEVDAWFTDALEVHAEGISRGVFPAVPGEPVGHPRDTFEHCKYCAYDQVCHSERDEIWSRAEAEEPLAPYVELLSRQLPEDTP